MVKYIGCILFQFILLNACFGQLCTGSLGDPVLHVSFGDYLSPKQALKAGLTNLKYVQSCPNEGEYTITSFSFGCFNNTWQYLVQDHTGDLGGRFMVINASLQPSEFYVDTVSGLCGNTVYEFAAWVANILLPSSCNQQGIKPNLTFKIETVSGTLLKQFNSGDIKEETFKTWKQFGTFFSTPTGVSAVVLRIINNAPGGCGNDLILDDITFRPCGPQVIAHPDNYTSNDINLCENQKNDLHFVASFNNSFLDPLMQWQIYVDSISSWVDIAGETNPTFTRKPTAGGLYKYRMLISERTNFNSQQCRLSSNVTNIFVAPVPDGPTLTNVMGCTNTILKIIAIQADGIDLSYQWIGPNAFSSNLSSIIFDKVKYQDSGIYQVVVKTNFNCIRTDTFHLQVFLGAKAIVSADKSVCEGQSVAIQATGAVKYEWKPITGLSNPFISNPIATPTDSIRYQVIFKNEFGCKDSAYTAVNIWKKPIVNAGPDMSIFKGESVVLNGSITGSSISYFWWPNTYMTNANSLHPTVNPTDMISYTLSATSDLGCGIAQDDVTIKVYKKIDPPNSFTPNGDGINDTWIIQGLDTYPNSEVKVFSRSGSIVFYSMGNDKIWDGKYNGKPLPIGAYYYLIDLKVGQPIISGSILIIR
jgi:gliding motility-associated-like protein